jgi:hypothetical protein
MTTKTSNTALTMLGSQRPPFVPECAEAMTVRIDLPPGDPGSRPHRHSGPVMIGAKAVVGDVFDADGVRRTGT